MGSRARKEQQLCRAAFRASMSGGSLLVHKTCQFMSPFFAKLIFLECHDSTGFCGCPTESACWTFCLQYCGLRFHIVQDGSSFPARFATLGEMLRHAATNELLFTELQSYFRLSAACTAG